MQRLTILNTREVKKINQMLQAQFDATLQNEYAYLQNQKNKLFVVTKDISRIELKNLRIDRYGLYLGEVRETSIRLSKEGAQLLVHENETVSNVIDLTTDETERYFKGEDIERDLGEGARSIILTHAGNTLGAAQYKEGTILNFLPKVHRRAVIV